MRTQPSDMHPLLALFVYVILSAWMLTVLTGNWILLLFGLLAMRVLHYENRMCRVPLSDDLKAVSVVGMAIMGVAGIETNSLPAACMALAILMMVLKMIPEGAFNL